MKPKELRANLQLLNARDIRHILWRIRFRWLLNKTLAFLPRVDLWLFPPLTFASNFIALDRLFPYHPMRLMALLASSFASTTLALFLLRPPRKPYPGHWVH